MVAVHWSIRPEWSAMAPNGDTEDGDLENTIENWRLKAKSLAC